MRDPPIREPLDLVDQVSQLVGSRLDTIAGAGSPGRRRPSAGRTGPHTSARNGPGGRTQKNFIMRTRVAESPEVKRWSVIRRQVQRQQAERRTAEQSARHQVVGACQAITTRGTAVAQVTRRLALSDRTVCRWRRSIDIERVLLRGRPPQCAVRRSQSGVSVPETSPPTSS